jgi:aromatic-L-amino-acid decarboxylase
MATVTKPIQSPDPADLELSPATMQAMGEAVVRRAVAHLASLDTMPSRGDLDVEALLKTMKESAPEQGTALEPLLERIYDDWAQRSFNTIGPGYFAFIPGGGVYPAALADFITDTTNRFTGIWQAAPALVQLEANVLDWLRDWMGFPSTTRGLFTTGGSMANFNAIVCAREKLLGTDIRAGVMYTSDQAHHSVVKSAKVAGVANDRVRTIPSDASFRMRVDALTAAIAEDRKAGLKPFLIVSSAGTTNTGAVDPLNAIADLCAKEGMWHHIDGAYGAFFHMVPELRSLLAGLPRADSLTLDPHKGMFLPYGTGALLVRDGNALRAVHSSTAGYLPQNQEEHYDPAQYGPELSRGFPGLRVWLAVKIYGAAKYRAAVAEKRALAVWAAERVAKIPGIVMDCDAQLSLFAFHMEGPGLETVAKQDAATKELMELVTRRGRVMVTGSTAKGRFLGRVCVLSFRSRQKQMEQCVDDIAAVAAEILAKAATARG